MTKKEKFLIYFGLILILVTYLLMIFSDIIFKDSDHSTELLLK